MSLIIRMKNKLKKIWIIEKLSLSLFQPIKIIKIMKKLSFIEDGFVCYGRILIGQIITLHSPSKKVKYLYESYAPCKVSNLTSNSLDELKAEISNKLFSEVEEVVEVLELI